ncbi:MAG: NUDIX hydrolase [Marinosulfonomonas sp.]|nr:NUDIX hydrolase [Marinosulfonomonas sp.]
MSLPKVKQRPIKLPSAQKRELRTQFGALCYRIRKDKTQVLLVTSRGSKRWIVPKGWPMDDTTPAKAAAQEAFEEAGVEGRSSSVCLGIYSYTKGMPGQDLPCVVEVFPVKVKRLASIYPEMKQRQRKWFSLKKAAALVDDLELSQIIKGFDPRFLGR